MNEMRKMHDELENCERCGSTRGLQVHHRKLRKHGGTNDRANLIMVCLDCHNHIHAHPAWSREVGLLVSAYAEHPTQQWEPDTGGKPY